MKEQINKYTSIIDLMQASYNQDMDNYEDIWMK